MKNIIFNILQKNIDQDNWYIIDPRNQFQAKVYSRKSLEREAKIINRLLADIAKSGEILLWIAPFHNDIYNRIENNLKSRLIWISPVNFTPIIESYSDINMDSVNSIIIDSNDKLRYFLQNISRKNAFQILAHASLKKYDFEYSLSQRIKNSAIRIKTIEHFGTIWKYNFKKNLEFWLSIENISAFRLSRPDAMILGGPTIDLHIPEIRKCSHVWCADTALPALLSLGISPEVVFSIDAGYGSYEHFIKAVDEKITTELSIVLDPLSFSTLFRLGFKNKYTYANSNPLIQSTPNHFSVLTNETDDVYGLMMAVFTELFGKSLPLIYGRDGGHIKYATHLRGSAYHRRQYSRCNRLKAPETYFFHLSDRYSHN